MVSVATTKQNKEIVRRFAEEFINKGNYDTAEEFLAEGVEDHTPLGETTGRAAVVDMIQTVRAAFPDFVVIPEQIVADGDTVAVRMIQRGTHEGAFLGYEPTGKSFEVEAMAFLRLEEGKIVERWGRPDLLGVLRQLGITELPPS